MKNRIFKNAQKINKENGGIFMQAIARKISFFLVVITVMSLFMFGNVYASSEEKQDLKILVIEINPILNSITNKKLYPNNDGHPKVSEFFGQDTNKAIDEMKEDLEFASHGYLNIIMSYEYLNEFPTYKRYIKNTNLKRFTEELYLSLCTSSSNPDTGVWYDLITNNAFSMVPAYSFDYEYLIEKFDLIDRRNAGEFDQVWINSIDPVQTFETMMVGKAPYWINGTPLKKDCNNFIIANISISRRDANLHALGHGVEGIMSKAFNGTTFNYNKTFDDTTEEKFRALNLWEQFSMTSSESSGKNSGIGNVHWPYNAEKDYDYTNNKKVYSYWKNWLNYPNLSGKKVLSDQSAWIKWKGNTSLGADQNKDPDRLYMRLWFYLFPHIPGVTEDGHLNNWWKYFVTLDYAESVSCKFDSKEYKNITKEISDTFFNVKYVSGAQKDIPLQADFAKISVQDTNILKLNKNGKLEVVSAGTTLLSCYVDGKFDKYTVEVSGGNGNYDVSFEKFKIPVKIVDDWAKEDMQKAEKMGLIPETFVSKDATKAITREEFATVTVKLYEALTGKKAEKISNNPFADTDNEYVLKAYNLGITMGISETKFGDGTITREQMATMIARSLSKAGIDTTVDLETTIKFVDDNEMHDWSRNSIYFMANKEIIKGIGENKFSTLGLAKVEEAIVIAVRCTEIFKK